jgi:hypothetical protein
MGRTYLQEGEWKAGNSPSVPGAHAEVHDNFLANSLREVAIVAKALLEQTFCLPGI